MDHCKYIKILNPIYPFKFHLLIGFKTISELKRVIVYPSKKHTSNVHELLDDLNMSAVDGYTLHYSGNIYIIIKSLKEYKDYDTLHHEIVHAVNYAAEHIGIEPHKSSEEFYSYLTGFLTGRIYKELKLSLY